MRAAHHRSIASLSVVALLAAACTAATGSPAPSVLDTRPSPSSASAATPAPTLTPVTAPPGADPAWTPAATLVPSPNASTSSAPEPAPAPARTPVPPVFVPGSPWVPASTFPSDPDDPGSGSFDVVALLPLGDDGALAIGRDATQVTRWSSETGAWTAAPGLPTPRVEYTAVALPDGRVLVAGGLDPSDFDRLRSYSSSYVFDPATRAWSKTGLMATARAAPAVAVLPDGRVLAAGGSYIDGPAFPLMSTSRATLTSAAAPESTPDHARPPADIAPPTMGLALATAEILDPRTGRWTTTGPMRYAVAGAASTTLTDGRVLVVAPGAPVSGWGPGESNWGWVDTDPHGFDTAEVYDPVTGRFALVGSLPPIDWEPLRLAGMDVDGFRPQYSSVGTLVALPGGDALLVGDSRFEKNGREVTRSFRFHGATGSWAQVGPTWACWWEGVGRACTRGIDLAGAVAAALPDGRVLVAGGATKDGRATDVARAYDPVSGGWGALDDMPVPRNGGRAASLADGSILVAGGRDPSWHTARPVRYVP